MKWYFRSKYGNLILYSGSYDEMKKWFSGQYKDYQKHYEIISEQQLKEESWEF